MYDGFLKLRAIAVDLDYDSDKQIMTDNTLDRKCGPSNFGSLRYVFSEN